MNKNLKITVVGNHCTWTKEPATSFIINDEMLFDVPDGTFKLLYNDYDLSKIKTIIFSHFHSDHFLDIYLVVDIFARTNQKVTIIAPPTCKERILKLLDIVEVGYLASYIENYVTFIDSEDEKEIEIDNYKIKCFEVVHSKVVSFGYTITYNNQTAGFSGDTVLCEGLEKIIQNSKHIMIDYCSLKQSKSHIIDDQVKELALKNKDKYFHAVHLRENYKDINILDNLKITTEGEDIFCL